MVDGTSSKKFRTLSWLWGPAFVASVAYVDPGNVAANLTSGAKFGYRLVWVLVLANMVAMLVQYLSAKLGLVTGQSLTQIIGRRMKPTTRMAYLIQAEIIAITTDLAEVVGGAIALEILFGVPLLLGGVIVGAVSLGLLIMQARYGQRRFEHVIIGLLVIITIGFIAGLFVSGVHWSEAVKGLVPSFDGTESILLAASMLGATVMPHAIYVHSSLTVDRHGSIATNAMAPALRSTRTEVLVSLVIAGGVNVAMLILAASALQGVPDTDTIQGAHSAIESNLGPVIATLFAVGLLASGLASSSVGAHAGITIMKGMVTRQIPLIVMRLITLAPALLILGLGVNPTWALIFSQVVLSFGIPFALIPLVVISSGRDMGQYKNPLPLTVVSWLAVGAIVILNLLLIVLIFAG